MSPNRLEAVYLVALVQLLLAAVLAWRDRHQRERRPTSAGLLLVGCGLWLLVNSVGEGPVLLHVAQGHGLTLADVPGLLLGAWAVGMLVASWLAHRGRPSQSSAQPVPVGQGVGAQLPAAGVQGEAVDDAVQDDGPQDLAAGRDGTDRLQ